MSNGETAKVVAELGINSNGCLKTLKSMALEAKASGADFLKLQKRDIDLCYTPEELMAPCDSPWGTTVECKVRGREHSWEELESFDKYTKLLEIGWSASCFDLRSLRWLEEKFPDRPFNKVASAMALHPEFLKAVASYQRLTLLSTGLLADHGIVNAADVFEDAQCPYVIMHTVALYPCPLERLNLQVISVLQELFHKKQFCMGIGYSGHETGVLPSTIAAGLGATWIERHFTLDRAMYGGDQAASLEPKGLANLVRDIRSLPLIKGTGVRKFHGDEKNPVKHFIAPEPET
jgi:N-acetylneuraminate synthase